MTFHSNRSVNIYEQLYIHSEKYIKFLLFDSLTRGGAKSPLFLPSSMNIFIDSSMLSRQKSENNVLKNVIYLVIECNHVYQL